MFNLKEYKDKYESKIKSKKDNKKMPLKEENENSLDDNFISYTDRVSESAEESLLDYGVIRNPMSGRTIIGVDKNEEDKYDSFIILYLDVDDIIETLNNIEEGYFEDVEFSKGEIIDAINKNDGDISSVITTLMYYGGKGNYIKTEIDTKKDYPMPLEDIKELVSNEEDVDNLEATFDDDGELEGFDESSKNDIKKYLPEAVSYKNIEDELLYENQYKIVYKDDMNNCKVIDRVDTRKVAEVVAESIVGRLKNRVLPSGAKIFIYPPYNKSDKPFKIVTESNIISLNEEVGSGDGLGDVEKNEFEEKRRDGTGAYGKRNRKATEKCPLNEETREEIKNMDYEEQYRYVLEKTNVLDLMKNEYSKKYDDVANPLTEIENDSFVSFFQVDDEYSDTGSYINYNIVYITNKGDIYFQESSDDSKEFIGNIYELEEEFEEKCDKTIKEEKNKIVVTIGDNMGSMSGKEIEVSKSDIGYGLPFFEDGQDILLVAKNPSYMYNEAGNQDGYYLTNGNDAWVHLYNASDEFISAWDEGDFIFPENKEELIKIAEKNNELQYAGDSNTAWVYFVTYFNGSKMVDFILDEDSIPEDLEMFISYDDNIEE